MMFETYPGPRPEVPQGPHDESPQRFVVCAVTAHAQQQSVEFIRPQGRLLSESEAIDVIDRLARGHSAGSLALQADDIIVRISEREVMVYRTSAWTGNKVVRFVVGQV